LSNDWSATTLNSVGNPTSYVDVLWALMIFDSNVRDSFSRVESRKMKQTTIYALLLSAVVGLSGCASVFDGAISCEMSLRNKVLAHKAWGHWSWVYDDLDYPWHFAKGFKAGYRNILDGGNGCQPTLPPQHYWKPCYQTPEGHCKTHAWFDGFSHGALAAKQDGYGAMGEIPISPTARANIETARRKPAQDLFYPNGGGYPAGPVPQMDHGIELSAPPVLPENGINGEAVAPPANTDVPMRPYE